MKASSYSSSVSCVQGTRVRDHDHAVELIKAAGRPLAMTFALGKAARHAARACPLSLNSISHRLCF